MAGLFVVHIVRVRGATERILRRLIRLRSGRPNLTFKTTIGRPRKSDDDDELDRLILGNDFF
jgi:hypothetical protein